MADQTVVLTRQITFTNCIVEVARGEDGSRTLQILDPGGHTLYLVPLPAGVARKIRNELFSAVPVAQPGDVPKDGK